MIDDDRADFKNQHFYNIDQIKIIVVTLLKQRKKIIKNL